MQTPGEEIRKQLKERNWIQSDLARIIERPLQTINAIIKGKRSITPEMAVSLGAAFGTEPEKWMLLESKYRLSLAKTNPEKIEQRARLYDYAPIKEMERRGWIPRSTSAEEQEKALCRFFEISSLNEEPQINVITRKSTGTQSLSASQKAWCFRARQLAKAIQVSPFKKANLNIAASKLRELAAFPEEARHIPKTLAAFGIRFLVVEPLPSSKIDGATIWLNDTSPVIAVSLRYNRIDAFWFTLLHEFYHVVYEDSSIDDDLFGDRQIPTIAKEEAERKADNKASDQLVPSYKLNSFILRVSPLFSKKHIIQFAHTIKIHPGIIVGQLQHRGEIGYSTNRELLIKIREIVTSSTLTDGWGRSITINTN
ncbi:MAG: helix-turn-helix domain-containing protein [Sedimentisphaerales bacterium]